jgi:hypothetical protein
MAYEPKKSLNTLSGFLFAYVSSPETSVGNDWLLATVSFAVFPHWHVVG